MSLPTLQTLPPFPGLRDEAFAFLRNLKVNNDRDWFKPRKQVFEDELQWPMRCLLADAARRASDEGLPLTADPKRALFRIYRDTRFSKNKQPYKTHVGAVLSRSGTHKDNGVVYIHVEPGASFLGAGFYRLDNSLLNVWRTHFVEMPAAFLDVVQQLEARGLELCTTDDALKRGPAGFEEHREGEMAEYLCWKSFLVRRPVADDALRTPDFTNTILQLARDVEPLLAYGWEREAATHVQP